MSALVTGANGVVKAIPEASPHPHEVYAATAAA